VVVGLLYPVSFGPACWITSRTGVNGVIPKLYRPMLAAMPAPPEKAPLMPGIHGGRMYGYPDGIINSYATVGAAPGWMWRYSAVWEPISATHEYRRSTEWQWEWCDASK